MRHRRAGIPDPDPWLTGCAAAFGAPLPGPVLDVACGLGQNALWAARLGHRAVGVDASLVAVRRAAQAARAQALAASFVAARVRPGGRVAGGRLRWGAILVFHFLDRGLFETLQSGLAPGGVLAFKTHLRHRLRTPGSRPRRRAYLLEPGELLHAFPALVPLRYEEWTAGGGAWAALLARRPLSHSS